MLYISFDPTQMEFSHQQWQLLVWEFWSFKCRKWIQKCLIPKVASTNPSSGIIKGQSWASLSPKNKAGYFQGKVALGRWGLSYFHRTCAVPLLGRNRDMALGIKRIVHGIPWWLATSRWWSMNKKQRDMFVGNLFTSVFLVAFLGGCFF